MLYMGVIAVRHDSSTLINVVLLVTLAPGLPVFPITKLLSPYCYILQTLSFVLTLLVLF